MCLNGGKSHGLDEVPAAEGKKTVLAAGGSALDELQPPCARGHRVLDTC